jgi:hypothetical protein
MGGRMNSDEEVCNSYSSPKQYLDDPFEEENVGGGVHATRVGRMRIAHRIWDKKVRRFFANVYK